MEGNCKIRVELQGARYVLAEHLPTVEVIVDDTFVNESPRVGFIFLILSECCGSAAALQHASRRVGFFADVAHSNDARWVPDPRGSRDVADFFAVEGEERIRFGHGVAGKSQLDALAVDLAARAHALDDFLAGVAAFGVTDVAVLQARLVGDLFFAEVVAEPGDALGEAGFAPSRVFHPRGLVATKRRPKNLAQSPDAFPLRQKIQP